ncbi:MAG: hypothetical protein LBO76_07395 [Treponema sp.]|jgi:hypothetical protein|nr:hypothetical protein [Treponema sp.]
MKKISAKVCAVFAFFSALASFGQTHGSIALDDEVYYILEQCEVRGLCAELPAVRPWTRGLALARVNEALTSAAEGCGALNNSERRILENYRDSLGDPAAGGDYRNGSYFARAEIGETGVEISGKAGVEVDIGGSAGLYPGDAQYGAETWVNASLAGDIGRRVSYGLSFSGGIIRVPREKLGTYHTYYDTFTNPDPESSYQDREVDAYSQPLTHFPYSYEKKWDSSVYFFNNLSGYSSWPGDFAGAYGMGAEFAGSFLDGRLFFRAGRFERDWGSTPLGTSLALNQAARPFLGAEGVFTPFPWLSVSSLTGVLEYYNEQGIKASSMPNQNAFTVSMLNLAYKNYLFVDVGEAVVWPKRFEIGYMSPITDSFFYQGNVGDFDNLAMFLNLKAQYPGRGNVWFSVFLDEISIERDMFILDRSMIAFHGGLQYSLPSLPFGSIKLSYTKIEPYCYTHTTIDVPWYRIPVEQAYTNNGVGLGYYLPPNADELLVRFDVKPAARTSAHFQYQMIRHGADYGKSAVDGSSLVSELDPDDRSSNPVLRKYFLHDGAYQWYHILKLGGDHSFAGRAQFRVSAEAGLAYSQFSDTGSPPNSGSSSPYHMIDTAEYPRRLGFVFSLGLRIFPKI